MKLYAQVFTRTAQGKRILGSLYPPELCEEIAKILYFVLALFSVGRHNLRKYPHAHFSLAVSK